MGKKIVKFYGDGEFWIDGKKRAKLHPDGEIWADGKRVGRLYEDGEIWIDAKKVGYCTKDGEIWIGGKRVATGIHMLSVLERTVSNITHKDTPSYTYKSQSTKYSSSSGSSDIGSVVKGGFFVLFICSIIASFLLWFKGLPEVFAENLESDVIRILALICSYASMLYMCYRHWKKATDDCLDGLSGFVGSVLLGLPLQGVALIINIWVFYILDVISRLSHYGLTLLDLFANFGEVFMGMFAGFIPASILITIFFGLAPSITVSAATALYFAFKGRRRTYSSSYSSPKKYSSSSSTSSTKSTSSTYSTSTSSSASSPKSTSTYSTSSTSSASGTKAASSDSAAKATSSTSYNGTSSSASSSKTSAKPQPEIITHTVPHSSDTPDKRVHICTCGCKLRFPINQGEYTFTCPKCKKSYTYRPQK